ncbi:MAG: hypothetical protein ACREN2_02410 [Candidatus Dormibacteria bacterium]
MNLTLADLRALPLASALVGADGEVVASTPEWRGDGPGAASYPVRRSRLVVCVEPAAPDCAALLDRLLCELDSAAASATRPRSQQVRMLAASLRLVAGRSINGGASLASDDVLVLARAGIEARTGLRVRTSSTTAFDVAGGDAAALALVQLGVNAERHGGATEVTIGVITGAVGVMWRGDASTRVTTARRHQDRHRWGLGFARIAADAMGATVHAPQRCEDGRLVALLEVGVPRLTLPLAAVRDQRVVRATRSWDEETGALPGTPVTANQQVMDSYTRAAREPGAIARTTSMAARSTGDLTWIAVPPDDAADRARDVVDGLTHEQALVDGVAEPQRSRINALAQLLNHALGAPLQRVVASAWSKRVNALARPFELRMPVPAYDGAGAVDPSVSALLAAEAGERFEVEGDSLWLRVRAAEMDSPLVRGLVSPGSNRILLG